MRRVPVEPTVHDLRPMPMLKLMLAVGLVTATIACGAAHRPTAVRQSPASGLVLDNNTAHVVTLRGCAGCGSGHVVPPGAQQGFALPGNSSRVELDEAGGRTRCLTIMQGVASDKATVVKASDAGPC
jgi:hypothetical protein